MYLLSRKSITSGALSQQCYFHLLVLSVECPYFVAADVLSALTLNCPPPQVIACFQKSDLWKHVVHKLWQENVQPNAPDAALVEHLMIVRYTGGGSMHQSLYGA